MDHIEDSNAADAREYDDPITEDGYAAYVAEAACTNPNHGYFIRHGVPCTCAVGTPDPKILRLR